MAASRTRSTPKQPRLGRGLSSLMAQPVEVEPPSPDAPRHTASSPSDPNSKSSPGDRSNDSAPGSDHEQSIHRISYIPVNSIEPSRYQPRQVFDRDALDRLANSIRVAGVMQPIIVRPKGDDDKFELIAGERRWRAARLADLDRMPAVVQSMDDKTVAEWSLIENLQREDLNPLERAEAFQGLKEKFNLSHEQIADRVGVDRSTITNTIRLLALDDQVQDLIREGLLSTGQAKVLAGLDNREQQRLIARRAVAQDWPVRRIEQEVRRVDGDPNRLQDPVARPPTKSKASHLADLERQLSEQLGTKVRIRPGRKKGSGTLSIDFYSLDQFDTIMARLAVEPQ